MVRSRTWFHVPSSLLFLVLALGSLVAPPEARAVQASASLSVIPTDWGPLHKDDLVEVVIAINNTSTDTPASGTPADGVAPVHAVLTGDISVLLACTDELCNGQASGKLAFVPVGGSGCVDKDPAVASCAASGPNGVLISLGSSITVPAGGSLDIATIRLKVLADDVGRLGIMALTDPAAVRACSSNATGVCTSCDASGCSLLVFGGNEQTFGCPHACPERIIFRGDAATPDFFEFHGLIFVQNAINPANPGFAISLSNANGPIFAHPSGNAPPVVLVQQGAGTYTYTNNAARTDPNGGIAFIKLSERDGMINKYKIDVQLFDPMLEAKATLANMTVSFTLSGNTYSASGDWLPRQNGWLLNLPRVP
jgi:hypothetical protein